jgi:biopolymer transport protein ExbD
MDFRPLPSEDEPRIDLTSLIDVVFILLIFFMVTTTFNRQSELKVELPEASSEVEKLPEEPIRLVIDRDGRYFINGNEVVNTREETLQMALDKALADNRERPVILQADARTEHQAVVTAMDAAAKLGVSQLSIATTQSAGDQ